MESFFDFLIQVCKRRVEQSTGKVCDLSSTEEELYQIFKTANIDRKNKYKIRKSYETEAEYRISRKYAIAIAIALRFPTMDEFNNFLSKAGYSLTEYHKVDVIIRNILVSSHGQCTVHDVNDALDDAGLKAPF